MSLIDEHEQCVSHFTLLLDTDASFACVGGSSLSVSFCWLELNNGNGRFNLFLGGCKSAGFPRDHSFCGHTILQR